jgi:hypothetical protein
VLWIRWVQMWMWKRYWNVFFYKIYRGLINCINISSQPHWRHKCMLNTRNTISLIIVFNSFILKLVDISNWSTVYYQHE